MSMRGRHHPIPMPTADARARTVLERCDALAALTEEPGRLTRRFATPELRAAGELVERWMREAGLQARRDAVGNAFGRRGEGGILLGSHLDTVRDAGRYDGMLGVLVALACAENAPGPVEVVAFADEEGVRYGTAYLGSAAVAGRFEPAWLNRLDSEDVAMADALRAFGGDPEGIAAARRDDVRAYVEVHIEQGPVLEARGVPVGVVDAIAGQSRVRVEFAGAAGHAGTVPMGLRRDALVAAAEWIVAVDGFGRRTEGLVCTVGEAAVSPGTSSVVPGRVVVSLDVRHGEDEVREAACAALLERAEAIGAARRVEVAWEEVQATATVACSPDLTRSLAAAVEAAGHPLVRLVSGAGHDAAMMAAVAPVAMLFVRCAGGVSHDPAESVEVEDVAAAIDVLDRFLSTVLDRGSIRPPGQDGGA
jgi:allantoate deiminase